VKRYLGSVLVLACCVLAVMGGRTYYTYRYRPIQAVQPIVRLLEEGGTGNVESGTFLIRGLMWGQLQNGRRSMTQDPNRIKITGAGAEEVKRSLLKAMEKETEPEALECLLICVIGAREEGNIGFRGEKEWAIIGAAAERHNADPTRTLRFFVTKDTNGVTVLGLGSTFAIP
jgi:hypothetical protein